jgi:hypothetical protein
VTTIIVSDMHGRTRFLVVATIVGIVASGCGGADKVRNGLSKTAYLTRADAICASTTARLLTLGVPQSPEQFGPFAQKAAPVVESAVRRLRALTPPAAIAAAVADFHANLFRRASAAAQAGDRDEAQRLAQAAGTEAEAAGAQAKAIGFHVCSRIPRL